MQKTASSVRPPYNPRQKNLVIPPEAPLQPGFLRKDYICVVDTCDEFEDLIGIVEEFLLPNGECGPRWVPGSRVIVYFPYTISEIRQTKLRGVNTFTSFVRMQLHRDEGRVIFDTQKLEYFDPENL